MSTDQGTLVNATVNHATFVDATFVHATFVHAIFVQGQNLAVFKCNHSCLDQTNKFCPGTNVVWKNVARTDGAMTNVTRTDVAWATVAWTNVAWSNCTGPLVNSQGWFHKLEMSSTVLSLWGVGKS